MSSRNSSKCVGKQMRGCAQLEGKGDRKRRRKQKKKSEWGDKNINR